jgi:hypothetical protein
MENSSWDGGDEELYHIHTRNWFMKRNNECTGKTGEYQPRNSAPMLGRKRTRTAGMPSNGETCTEWFMQPLAEALSGTGSLRLGLPLQLRHIASLSAHHSQSCSYEFLAVEPISAQLQQFSTSAISTPQSLPSTTLLLSQASGRSDFSGRFARRTSRSLPRSPSRFCWCCGGTCDGAGPHSSFGNEQEAVSEGGRHVRDCFTPEPLCVWAG